MAEKKTPQFAPPKPAPKAPVAKEPEVDPAANYTGTGERDPEPK